MDPLRGFLASPSETTGKTFFRRLMVRMRMPIVERPADTDDRHRWKSEAHCMLLPSGGVERAAADYSIDSNGCSTSTPSPTLT